MSGLGKFIGTQSILVVARLEGEERKGVTSNGDSFFLGVIKMSWNHTVVMVAQYCECTKCHYW